MVGLIVYFSLALVVSFVCSLLEAVILSLSRGQIEAMIQRGQRGGELLKELKDDIDRPLAAILTLNTVAHTVGAAGVGAQVLLVWGNQWVALASAILTVLILVFSEIIPKTLGAEYRQKLAPVCGRMIRFLVILLYPIVLVLERISSLFVPAGSESKVSREEVMAIAELGSDEGALHHQENRVIQNLLHLRNIRVIDILTPRSVMLSYQRNTTIKEVVEKHSPIRFSRIPIYSKDLDEITGIVMRYKILQEYSIGRGEEKLDSIKKPISAVPNTKSVASTLDEFIQKHEQLFLVVDEYGGTEGIVTLEDVIETLLGVEIIDEMDAVKDMRKLAKDLWERRRRQHQN